VCLPVFRCCPSPSGGGRRSDAGGSRLLVSVRRREVEGFRRVPCRQPSESRSFPSGEGGGGSDPGGLLFGAVPVAEAGKSQRASSSASTTAGVQQPGGTSACWLMTNSNYRDGYSSLPAPKVEV
ncbi:unnamed protein product, partial [Urochloa humidicola]